MSSEGASRADEGGLGPLTADEVAILSRASMRAHTVTRAATLASLNGWSFAACALLCVPLALVDPPLLWVGACLAAIAVVELRGGRRLRAFDGGAPRWLALNQVVLFLLVAAYCGLRLWEGLTGPTPQQQLLAEHPEVAELIGSMGEFSALDTMFDHIDHIYRLALIGLYGGILVVSALYQGLCAFYYWSRAPHLTAYVQQTPRWVRELQARMQP